MSSTNTATAPADATARPTGPHTNGGISGLLDAAAAATGTGDGFDRMRGLAQVLDRAMHALVSEVETLTTGGRTAGPQTLDVGGLPVATAIRAYARFSRRDEREVSLVADRLRHLPVLRQLWATGQVRWPVVRTTVHATRRLPLAAATTVDEALPSLIAEYADAEIDLLLSAIEWTATHADPATADRNDDRIFTNRFVHTQAGFDGSVSLYAELDPISAAPVLAVLDVLPDTAPTGDGGPTDAATDADTHAPAAPSPDTPAATGNGETEWAPPTRTVDAHVPATRGQARADALTTACRRALAADTARTAKPSILVTVPHTTLTRTATAASRDRQGDASPRTGRTPEAARHPHPEPDRDAVHYPQGGRDREATVLLADTAGPRPIADTTLAELACDATLTIITTDPHGAPLTVGRRHRLVPDRLRTALIARDGGCRFPTCTAPPSWTDAHHITPWTTGGTTDPDNLVLLCRRHHTTTHRHHWHLTLAPDATLTATRGTRTLHSHPRHRPPRVTDPPPGSSEGPHD